MAVVTVLPMSLRSIDRPSLLRRSPFPMRRWRLLHGDPTEAMRNEMRESVSDESRKMIRALSRYLHAHIACQQNPCSRARKMRVVVIAMRNVCRACRASTVRRMR